MERCQKINERAVRDLFTSARLLQKLGEKLTNPGESSQNRERTQVYLPLYIGYPFCGNFTIFHPPRKYPAIYKLLLLCFPNKNLAPLK